MRICYHPARTVRREGALARFRVLSEQEYKGNDYPSYVARKQQELSSLKQKV